MSRPRLLPPLRTLANATADDLHLPRPPASAAPRIGSARGEDAGEAALMLLANLAAALMLGHAVAEALPLLDVLVDRGYEQRRVSADYRDLCMICPYSPTMKRSRPTPVIADALPIVET